MGLDDSLIGFVAELDDSRATTGEQRLIAAVLERAINDARRGDPGAVAWLASDEDILDEGWSYLTVCAHLGMDRAWLRAMVAADIEAHPYVRRPNRPAALEQAAA